MTNAPFGLCECSAAFRESSEKMLAARSWPSICMYCSARRNRSKRIPEYSTFAWVAAVVRMTDGLIKPGESPSFSGTMPLLNIETLAREHIEEVDQVKIVPPHSRWRLLKVDACSL